MPLALAIESSNPSAGRGAGVALGMIDGVTGRVETLGVEPLRESARHDDDLMPAIDRLVRRAGQSPSDLALIAVSVGPGGYTGLRIAVAAANLIAYAVDAKTVPVPSALVAARRVEPGARPFAVALASKAASTCVTCFDALGRPLGPMHRLIGEDELESLGVARLIADQFLPASIRERAAALNISIDLRPGRLPRGRGDARSRAPGPDLRPRARRRHALAGAPRQRRTPPVKAGPG
jgi:tRNA threonylcarbamoyl adenosine modification protein YeaZ